MEIILTSISAILQKIFDDRISDLIAQGKDAVAYRGFLKNLTEWCEAFILEHETENVAGEGFSRYLQYHRPIENIFEYIKNPKDVAEQKLSLMTRIFILRCFLCPLSSLIAVTEITKIFQNM